MTYHDAYVMAYEKCRQARDEKKTRIEIQNRASGPMLIAHRTRRGTIVVLQPSDSICEWATKIANKMAQARLCDLPVTTE